MPWRAAAPCKARDAQAPRRAQAEDGRRAACVVPADLEQPGVASALAGSPVRHRPAAPLPEPVSPAMDTSGGSDAADSSTCSVTQSFEARETRACAVLGLTRARRRLRLVRWRRWRRAPRAFARRWGQALSAQTGCARRSCRPTSGSRVQTWLERLRRLPACRCPPVRQQAAARSPSTQRRRSTGSRTCRSCPQRLR